MGRVRAAVIVPGRMAEAEALWYDTSRWPSFVDGFAHVSQLDDAWPAAGATLVWDSVPAGRGRVVETVTAHAQRGGQTLSVEDERLRGTQTVAFAPEGDDATRVTLELAYQLKQRHPFTPIVDLVFVRRALGESLRRTLTRFARERRGDDELT